MYNVMIAEDDMALRFVYSKMKIWTDYGFRISAEVKNGREALSALKKQSFDMIFTDIKMPFVDGIKLLREIKKRNINAPVVFVSSYDEFEYARQGIVLGAFDYIVKPADESKLEKLLERAKKFLAEKSENPQISEIVLQVMADSKIDGENDILLRKTCIFISENIHRAFTMQDVADALELNKDYFGKQFKIRTGMKFGDFYSRLKVECAKYMLETGNYKNYEISEKLGYSNPDYFTKAFKDAMGVVYLFCKFLAGRKFGKLLVAIRDGENRTYFSGYQVSRYKTFVYVLSAVIAGIAGAVFVNFNGSITPSQMTISYSITMVIWVAIGGRGTIIGAVIGAFLINLCEYNLSSGAMVEIWQYIIGALFCVTILFFKGGIVGFVRDQLPAAISRMKKTDKTARAAKEA